MLLPWDFAVTSLEAKLSAAGITTAFHGAGFQEKTAGGVTRSVRTADEVIAERDARLLTLERNIAWLGSLARAGRIRLVGHDLDSPAAVAAAGLSDRGSLSPGLRADLALVDDSATWPVVRATFRAA